MMEGVSSASVFFSVTFPETGVYSSEAAFTLSRAPHSSDFWQEEIRIYDQYYFHRITIVKRLNKIEQVTVTKH